MSLNIRDQNSKLSMALDISFHESKSPETLTRSLSNHRLLVALERCDHTYHLGAYALHGTTAEKMVQLKVWRAVNTGKCEALGAYLLCKKPYIAIGKLGVSLLYQVYTGA